MYLCPGKPQQYYSAHRNLWLKKDITNHESIYNFIRNTALQFGGEITQEDVAQNEYDNLTSVDFSYFMDNLSVPTKN